MKSVAGQSCPVRERRGEGFTLIELMVALGLAAVISVSIMMISSQARLAYDNTVKMVDVYNRFRFAMQQIEADIKQWVPTGEMEFFQDGAGRGGKLNSHWDPGEEADDRSDPKWGPYVRDGGVLGEYDEFPFIEQGHYVSTERGQTEEKQHDAYRIYFQTFTYVAGEERLANVEYYLANPNKTLGRSKLPAIASGRIETDNVPDLMLVKVTRYYKIDAKTILKPNETPIEREFVEVATNITDFKLEYTVDPKLQGRMRAKEVSFVTPKQDYDKPLEVAVRPERIRREGKYLKRFGYGSVKLDVKYDKGTAYPGARGDRNVGLNRGRHEPVRFGFQGGQTTQFAQLIPGDKIFIFTESNRAARAAGGGGGRGAGAAAQLVRFPSGDYTVKGNRSGLLELREDIDSVEWNGQTQSGVLYKAPYVPAAVRITMRVVDDRGENPKTLQRVIWLRRRSR